MAIRVEKGGNNKQMLIFMNRMDLLRGSSGNNNLRRDVQKTGSNFVMWISEKIGCRNLNLWLHFINSNLMAGSICCGQPGYRQTGDYIPVFVDIIWIWSVVINWDDLSNWILSKFSRCALVIPTVPFEPLFGQGLARCDYFRTSLKMAEADILTIVVVIWHWEGGINLANFISE